MKLTTMCVCCALTENEGIVTVSVWQMALLVRQPRRLTYSPKRDFPLHFQLVVFIAIVR